MQTISDEGPVEANITRAYWALSALEAFGLQTGQNYDYCAPDLGSDVLTEVAGDLIADLFHLARFNDVEADALVNAALGHFEAEVLEETQAP